MNIFLIEDEPAALDRLKALIAEVNPSYLIAGETDSVEGGLDWLRSNPTPGCIITDIQLADGMCFDLFKQFSPQCPVLFITAYNNYALEAFQVNAVDYLLKPIKKEDLQKALEKVQLRKPGISEIDYSKLARAILEEEQKYQRRYLIRYGDQIRTVQSDEIAYFYTTQKSVFLVTFAGKMLPFDKSLDALEQELDPKKFFRINRQFIINMKSIGHMHSVSKSRVQLELQPAYKEGDVIVSTEKSPLFKAWLGDK